MEALLLSLLKGVLIFFGICFAIILISIAVGSLEISFGAGSRKIKENRQQEEED